LGKKQTVVFGGDQETAKKKSLINNSASSQGRMSFLRKNPRGNLKLELETK